MYKRKDDADAVLAFAETYFKAMIEANEKELRKIFHPQASVIGLFEGEFSFHGIDPFIEFITSTPAANDNGKTLEYYVEGLTMVGDTAVITVGSHCFNAWFTDHLSLIKTDGEWLIVAKTYTAVASVKD